MEALPRSPSSLEDTSNQHVHKKSKHQVTPDSATIEDAGPVSPSLNVTSSLDVTSSSSYKDALLQVLGPEEPVEEFWGEMPDDLPENRWYNEEATSDLKNPKQSTPGLKITYTEDELESWAKPWRNTLIVKVLGKKVNFRTLENKLRREWEVNGTMKIIDLAEDFYLVRLSSKEDYLHALFEGPWKVADHYIIVQRWQPRFSFSASISHKVAIWIRIPCIPMELSNETMLRRIGSALGTMLKIDNLTSIHDRGKYARICVEMDLNEPLPSHIFLNDDKLNLEYEGLHLICFRCGRYGHKKESCPEIITSNTSQETKANAPSNNVDSTPTHNDDDMDTTQTPDNHNA